MVNKEQNIREATKSLLENGHVDTRIMESQKTQDILLIDEVDEFFSPEFIGQSYRPIFIFRTPEIQKIIYTIWKFSSFDSYVVKQTIVELKEYQSLINQFKKFKTLLDNQIDKMIITAKLVANHQISHQYQVVNGKIGYKQQDHLSFTTYYGYETIFSYFLENSNGLIEDYVLNEQIKIGMIIKCGEFSYTELPKLYNKIFGLTGTFQSLHEKNKQFLKQYFNEFIRIPSLFLNSKLSFDQSQNIKVESDKQQYFLAIKSIINQREDRPVMIFFKDTQILKEFKNYMQFSEDDQFKIYVQITQTTQIDLEKTSNLDVAISKASHKGIVSLIDKSYGRGTDFVCEDKQIEKLGGMIVVQAFFSLDKSEEIQIKGRTARQTKSGEYFLVLLVDDLVSELELSKTLIEEKQKQMSSMYQFLSNQREIIYGKQFELHQKAIEKAYDRHQITLEFSQALKKGDQNQIISYLYKFNQQEIQQFEPSFHFIFVLDESSSMQKVVEHEYSYWESLNKKINIFSEEQRPKSNWEQVIESLNQFIKMRKNSNVISDKVSIIYYNSKARVIAKYEEVSNVLNQLVPPSSGNTLFIPALETLQEVLENEPNNIQFLKAVVLFLTDGSNQDNQQALVDKMNSLKTKFEKKITRWWNIKIGAGRQISLKAMTQIMNSGECDSQLMTTLNEQNLIEDFEEFANCDKFNF